MANEGASSISNFAAITPGAGAPPRQVGLPVRETTSGTVVTAEIPAVPAGPSYGVLLPDGSVWYPGSTKRLPAPLPLRVVVWVLAFLVLLATAADFVIRYHPSWVAPLRHTVPARSVGAPPAGSGNRAGAKGLRTTAVSLMRPQPSGLSWKPLTAYTVREPAFTIAVTAGSGQAYVAGQAYSGGRVVGTIQQKTLGAGTTFSYQTSRSALINIGAGGTTIKLYEGSKTLATVPTPPDCPCYLLFQPTGR